MIIVFNEIMNQLDLGMALVYGVVNQEKGVHDVHVQSITKDLRQPVSLLQRSIVITVYVIS